MDDAPFDASALNRLLAAATNRRLGELSDDRSLVAAITLLVKLTTASRQPGFGEALAHLGVEIGSQPTAFGVIVSLADQLQAQTAGFDESGHFAEISALSFSAVLTETVGNHGPGLLESTLGDVQDSFRAYATEARFGELAERYFGDFLARTFSSLVDRELANHVGRGGGIATVAESREVKDLIATQARETARAVRPLAGEWWSKRNWLSGGAISGAEIQTFIGHAVQKLRGAFAQAVA